jgi:membrane protein DedA with SNARE-associated domain
MVVEGPIVIMAASFAASMGYLNLGVIFILGILGDYVGDFALYSIGYFGKSTVIKKCGRKHGLLEARMDKLISLLEKHPGKIILAIKLSPIIPIPGLIMVGSSHISPQKFAYIITLIILPRTFLFVVLGYFFGNSYYAISSYVDSSSIAVIIILAVAFLFYYLYRIITGRISKKLEECKINE